MPEVQGQRRAWATWAVLSAAIAIPLTLSAMSPLHAWRDPIYSAAGFAGIVALCLLLVQPLLAHARLPGVSQPQARTWHRWVGCGVVFAIVLHVAGLWITSPPDVVDALLFASPTPFSAWGVIAMWAAFAAAALAATRKRLRWPPRIWRRAHLGLVSIVVLGTALHAVLIEGTMETISKWGLCGLVVAALGKVLLDQTPWGRRRTVAARSQPH